jgi:PPOX class probable F420-dependent enzyme
MSPLSRRLLDATTPRGKHILSRLKREIVIWFATTNPDGRPLVVPVWFLFDGDTFLIYSVPGQKVRNIERNAFVALHLNANPEGGDVVRVFRQGAAVEATAPGPQGSRLHPQVPISDQELRMDTRELLGRLSNPDSSPHDQVLRRRLTFNS